MNYFEKKVGEIKSNSVNETEKIGEILGNKLSQGDLIILEGTLAAGKTAFARGVVFGAGMQDRVTSPTFAIANLYNSNIRSLKQILHIDAYRLNSIDDFEILDLDSALQDGAVIIEWGKKFAEEISDKYLLIEFITNEDINIRTLKWEYIND